MFNFNRNRFASEPPVLPVAFYSIMLCVLIPIGAIAILASHNRRPTSVSYIVLPEGNSNRIISIDDCCLRLTDLKSTSSTPFPWLWSECGYFDNQFWAYCPAGDDDRFSLHLMDFKSGRAEQTKHIHFAEHTDDVMYRWKFVCFVDNHVIRFRSGNFESTSFLSDNIVDAVSSQIKETPIIQHIPDTKNFLATGPTTPTSAGSREHVLYEVREGKIIQIASWRDTEHFQISGNPTPFLVCFVAGGATVDVRNAITGDIISSYASPIDPTFGPPKSPVDKSSYQPRTIRWDSTPPQFTDAVSGKTLPIPNGSELIGRDLEKDLLITIRKKANGAKDWECITIDGATGKELNRFDVAWDHYCPVYLPLATSWVYAGHLVFATKDYRFFSYDLVTGKLIRTFNPFQWVDWCNRIAAIAFPLWCFVWMFVSSKLHPYGWIDGAICSGLVVAFVFYDTAVDLSIFHHFRIQYGIFASWILGAIWWLIFGSARWSLRVQPLLILAGLIVGIVAISRDGHIDILPTILIGLLLGVTFLFVLYLLRYIGLRFAQETGPVTQAIDGPNIRKSAVPLRDLFLWTIEFAFLFLVARFLIEASWPPQSSLSPIGFTASIFAISSLLAMWTAMSRQPWLARWGIWILLPIGNELLQKDGFVSWELLLPAPLATLLCFYCYRLRGWRLKAPNRMHVTTTSTIEHPNLAHNI